MTTTFPLANYDAFAVVLDAADTQMTARVAAMGGGWRVGITAFQASRAPYAVLVAYTRERFERRAPLTLLARNVDAVAEAAARACRLLDNVKCLWVRAVVGDALEAVDRVILADAIPAGRA